MIKTLKSTLIVLAVLTFIFLIFDDAKSDNSNKQGCCTIEFATDDYRVGANIQIWRNEISFSEGLITDGGGTATWCFDDCPQATYFCTVTDIDCANPPCVHYFVPANWPANTVFELDGDCYCETDKINNGSNGNFELKQNYPNPFNPITKISFNVPSQSNVKIAVYTLAGELVTALVDRDHSPGTYSVDFDGTNLSSGIYIYKLEAGEFTDIKKMILIK